MVCVISIFRSWKEMRVVLRDFKEQKHQRDNGQFLRSSWMYFFVGDKGLFLVRKREQFFKNVCYINNNERTTRTVVRVVNGELRSMSLSG